VSQEETSNILGGHSIGHFEQYIYVYMCPTPNGFRDRAISLHSSKTVGKKEILYTISNTGIYGSSDKVGTFSIIPPSRPMHFVTGVRTWRATRL
jgi:hypothetical protein